MGVVLVVLVVLVTGGKQSQLSPARLGLGLSLAILLSDSATMSVAALSSGSRKIRTWFREPLENVSISCNP